MFYLSIEESLPIDKISEVIAIVLGVLLLWESVSTLILQHVLFITVEYIVMSWK